ncbi:pyridoxal phosphate-dependent aminotransferase family protein [Flavicella sp.]|uniref:aminotransferase class I/II-fold pyridoxal phosphate-dependent enzyme n=1 Tax=Flavicella sp. TaxID=2957742 RepID=UPI00301AF067
MLNFPKNLNRKLTQRKENNSLRYISSKKNKIDFSSNDYLGFSREKSISSSAEKLIKKFSNINGSTGSRLVSGTHELHEIVENQLSKFHNSDAALLYNSGYDANIGLFSSVLQKGDTIIYDELIHASIRDGIRLSNAKSIKFKHNSLEDLKKKISRSEGTIYIVIESVYSMDGDSAPIIEISALSKKKNCLLIVDEAHSNGVFGINGAGIVQEFNLEKEIFARIHTFGKALGCHGAVVLGSEQLREYLINFSRSFIYTTAASLHSISTIKNAYDQLQTTNSIEKLRSNIIYFKETLSKNNLSSSFIESSSPIHCYIVSGNNRVKKISSILQSKGFDIKPILTPTVPEGEERLRICLHSYNTHKEIEALITLLAKK